MLKRVLLPLWLFFHIFLFSHLPLIAQNDVMMQAFYWDVPVDIANKNGFWWDNLSGKAKDMRKAGYSAIWVPAPNKANHGIYDMGYGMWDHYDLGSYYQKGTVETRFGSRQELDNMIAKMHENGIHVYADIVLNHIFGDSTSLEENPVVKNYVFNEAVVNSIQYQSYPTPEIVWYMPKAAPGDYYIQIKGYNLPWGAVVGERGYDLEIIYGPRTTGPPVWENEPNNGMGQYNEFPGSGRTVRAHIGSQHDIDEFKITLTSTQDIVINLVPKREVNNGQWDWVNATREYGYYPFAIWKDGKSMVDDLKAYTYTKIILPEKTGPGEVSLSWDYRHFHPVDENDFLEFFTGQGVTPNAKMFGNDINTFDPMIQQRLKDWGKWMAETVKFDGFRLDFVKGFQESFTADWVKALPLLDNKQRYIVGEYWGSIQGIQSWVNTVGGMGADVDAFDFPLKFTLTQMCNGDQSFDMKFLNHAGVVRNHQGHSLPGTSISTFVDNHDTGKEHDKWVGKDFRMGYAYILTHEGRPCVFYPHYYGVKTEDYHDKSKFAQAPQSLKDDIDRLMFIRRTYLGGSLAVLSQNGNPWPGENTHHVYAARRQGNGQKNGAIVVINNHNHETLGLWLDSSPDGYQNWAGVTLVDANNPQEKTVISGDGRVYVTAPARGYRVWVREDEFESYQKPEEIKDPQDSDDDSDTPENPDDPQNGTDPKDKEETELLIYPNPSQDRFTIIMGDLKKGPYDIKVVDVQGNKVMTASVQGDLLAYTLDLAHLHDGCYMLLVQSGNKVKKKKIVKIR
jgi:alpha-amylase